MFLYSRVENPLASTRTSYDPAGRFGTVYLPSFPVKVPRVSLVEGLVTVTFAPVTSAPLGSITVPFKVAVGSCAPAITETSAKATIRGRRFITSRFLKCHYPKHGIGTPHVVIFGKNSARDAMGLSSPWEA